MKQKVKKIVLCVIVVLSSFCAISQNIYNVVMNFTEDPTTQMAFNWFTDTNTPCLQIKILCNGSVVKMMPATCIARTNYVENKVVVTGLTPNTTYSFVIGSGVIWRTIGTFTTAPANKNSFSFITIADTQGDGNLSANSQIANTHFPNANFWLHCGDLLWEGENITINEQTWKNFFAYQPNLFLKKALVPTMGNHDAVFNNFNQHFRLNNAPFDPVGSTYTFTYGDAQFFAINSNPCNNENYASTEYLDSLAKWMYAKKDNTVTWHIAYCHHTIYSSRAIGTSKWQQKMDTLLSSLGIDLVFQGHHHVYDVIGPIKNGNKVQGSVINVETVAKTLPPNYENVNGKTGGIFNSQKGTVYITNGTFGAHWFGEIQSTYPLITGRAGTFYNGKYLWDDVNKPLYNNVLVASDKITIATHVIVGEKENRQSILFDEITIVKRPCLPSVENPVSQTISSNTVWSIPQSISNNIV
ncbi:MAG: metallophosphoesterase family protein, partial [Bacteroidales bacterium]|nr:metallophosphoesterase family protein [Bacteroidales bacterium]